MRTDSEETKNYFDLIFIAGSDLDHKKIIATLKALEADGKRTAIIQKTEDYAMLRGRIGSNTRIDIYAHGSRGKTENDHWMRVPPAPYQEENFGYTDDDKNKIVTHASRVFSYLAILTENPVCIDLQVHLWSCYGGRAAQSAEYLPIGSVLIIHAPQERVTFGNITEHHLLLGLKRHWINPFDEFMHVIAESPSDASFVYSTGIAGETLLLHRSPRMETVIVGEDEIKNQIISRLNNYRSALMRGLKINNTSGMPNIENNIQPDQLARYEKESVHFHAQFDQDVSRLHTYFQNKKMHPQDYVIDSYFLTHIATYRMQRNEDVTFFWNYITENKLDINQPGKGDADTMPPLQYLVWNRHLMGVDFLLSLGADVNCAGTESRTALIDAAYQGELRIVQRLLQEKNIVVDARRLGGYTALLFAAQNGFLEIVEILLQHGADPALRSEDGRTALRFAARNGHVLVVKRLLQDKRGLQTLDWEDDKNVTPLRDAAENGYADIVDVLAKNGADPNEADNNGTTPAMIAAEKGHASVITALARYSIDFNATDKLWGGTAVYFAVSSGRAAVVEALLSCDADFNIACANGETPLFVAAWRGDDAVITQLLKYKNLEHKPCFYSAVELRNAVCEKAADVQDRAEQWIQSKLWTGCSEERIDVLPYDAAFILGHHRIVELLDQWIVEKDYPVKTKKLTRTLNPLSLFGALCRFAVQENGSMLSSGFNNPQPVG